MNYHCPQCGMPHSDGKGDFDVIQLCHKCAPPTTSIQYPSNAPLPSAPIMPSQAENWGQCIPVAPRDHQAMFNGFGRNWRWGSVDYRGVARVHTFEPEFTASGRVVVPRPVGNSEPAPAFDVDVSGMPDWKPFMIARDMRAAGIHCPKPTDRFGVELPEGADPVEAADVVQAPTIAAVPPPPPPINFQTVQPCDRPFMEYIVTYQLVGSRVTCNPPPLDTDQDVLCFVAQSARHAMARSMIAAGFVAEGSWPTDTQSEPSNKSVFESMRKGSMNYIITSDDDFYKRFNAATALAKKLNIMSKTERIELFQAVLYGNAP